MNRIFAIFRKELLLKFSSRAEWLYFFILPVIFTAILSGGTGNSTDSRIRLLVTDQAENSASAMLIEELNASTTVRPDVMSLRQADNLMKQQNAAAHLIIPSGFSLEAISSGKTQLELKEQPNNLAALSAYQAVIAAANRVGSVFSIAETAALAAEKFRPFDSTFSRAAFIDETAAQAAQEIKAAPVRLSVIEGATPDKIPYDPRANSSTGQMITWVFIPLFGLSGIFAAERLGGTLRRVLITPSKKSVYLFGVIFSNTIFSLVQMLLLMLFGYLIMHVDWIRNPAATLIMMVSAVLAASAIGTALGTFVKTEAQAGGLSIMMGMVMALLGGCWYPMELFPEAVQKASMIFPTRWAMQGFLDILLRGEGITGILPEAGALLGFALVFYLIGILRFRYE